MHRVDITRPPSTELSPVMSIRTGLTADEIKQAFRDNLVCGMGRLEATATKHDLYFALALTVRDRAFPAHRREPGKLRRRRRATRGVSLRGVPARAASREQSAQPRHHGSRRAKRCAGSATTSMKSSRRRRSRASAMAGSGGWRRVTWIRSRRSKCRRSATASATSSAFSIRSSATAGSARSPTSG